MANKKSSKKIESESSKSSDIPVSQPKTTQEELIAQYNSPIMTEMQNLVSFEIFILLLIYRELSMAQITTYIHKSKPTVFRHLQKLVDLGVVRETREEKVRSDVPAKIYTADVSKFLEIPNITPDQLMQMDPLNKMKYYESIRKIVISTSQFGRSALERFETFYANLDSTPFGPLQQFMDAQRLTLTFNLLSESQYKKYIVAYQKFMIGFMGELIEDEKENPNALKPYLMLYSILPMTDIFGKKP